MKGALRHYVMESLRRKLAMMLVVAMVFTLLPSMGAMAAGPSQGTTTNTVVSVEVLYDENYYVEHNPDVKAAFGRNSYLLRIHFREYGVNEGRQYLTPILDVRIYRAMNPDLDKAFGDNWVMYLDHYVNRGAFEIAAGKRSAAGVRFDPMKYLASNIEVWRQTGGDLIAVMRHYIDSGCPNGDWVVSANPEPSRNHKSSSNKNNVTSDSKPGGSTVDQPGAGTNVGDNNGDSQGSSDVSGNNPGNTGDTSGNNPGNTGDVSGNDPNTPIEPDDPNVGPVEHDHTKDSFDDDGNCTVEGCNYKLVDFRNDCKIPPSEIELGVPCPVCGAFGTKQPGDQHTQESEHLLASFGNDGYCLGGCGLTLQVFQDEKCPKRDEHENLFEDETCSCGYKGTKERPFECSNRENHSGLHKDEPCSVKECDYVGEVPHTWNEETGYCTGCPAKCSQAECPKKGTHDEMLQGQTCICGYAGQKPNEPENPEPEECSNVAQHTTLHKGESCGVEGCGYVGEANHVWDPETGECSCGAKCSQAECPKNGEHNDLTVGQTCICGYEGQQEPENPGDGPEDKDNPENKDNPDNPKTDDTENNQGEVDSNQNQDPSLSGTTGGTGGGTMSGNEDGKEGDGTGSSPEEMPDAVLPPSGEVSPVIEDEPDPDHEGEDLVGDGTDDEDDTGDDKQSEAEEAPVDETE